MILASLLSITATHSIRINTSPPDKFFTGQEPMELPYLKGDTNEAGIDRSGIWPGNPKSAAAEADQSHSLETPAECTPQRKLWGRSVDMPIAQRFSAG
jgi:hypothetical protein